MRAARSWWRLSKHPPTTYQVSLKPISPTEIFIFSQRKKAVGGKHLHCDGEEE